MSGGTVFDTMSALFELPAQEAEVAPKTARGRALLEGLNDRQREAVTHAGSPLLIVAGAGSGKTRVLTHRIGWLLAERGVHPGEIMSITFTNKAAAEMKERVDALVGRRSGPMWVSTFHSMCVRILRREAKHLGVRSAFSVYDADDTRRLVGIVARDLELDPKKFAARALAGQISNLKNELISPDDAQARAATEHERRICEVYAVYQERLRQANAFDFDDLIMETVSLLDRMPAVAEYYRRRFRHVLVDEYQDTNHAQYELVRQLVRPATEKAAPAELCVVGDSDQSIYAFRGASIRNIVEFEQDFPNARTILLEQNYRSTQTILSAANAVIARNPERRDKRLWSDSGDGEQAVGYVADNEHDEARFVAAEIDRLVDSGEYRNSDIAVFYRTNNQSRVFEDVFLRVGLPYKVVGGVRFYERREIRDALAYLRVLSNPEDTVSLRRILNVPKRGIGDRAESLVAEHAERERTSFAAALRIAAEEPEQVPALATRSQRNIAGFVRMMDELRELVERGDETAEILEAVYAKTGYLEELQSSEDPQDGTRLDNLAELVTVAREFAGDAAVADLAALSTDLDAGSPAIGGGQPRGGRCPRDRRARRGRRHRRRCPAPGFAGRVPRAGRARRGRGLHPGRRPGHGHADDPAHGEGAGVPGRVPHRLGGRDLPAPAHARGPEGAGRGTPARLRRDHPRPQPGLPVPGDRAHRVRAAEHEPGVAVPGRGAGRARRLAPLGGADRTGAQPVRAGREVRLRPRRQAARQRRPRGLEGPGADAERHDQPRRRGPGQPRQVRPGHGRRRGRRRSARDGHDRLRQQRHGAADADRRRTAAEALRRRAGRGDTEDRHGRCVATASAPSMSPTERRPRTTPSMSAAGRFWLSLTLASTRSIRTSTPTIARS